MLRLSLLASVLVIVLAYSLASPAQGQKVQDKAPATDRPGDEVYLPTKLEWAALELQTFYRYDKEITVSFVPDSDGKTMICIMTYRSNVPVGTVKVERDTIRLQVEQYARTRKWAWMLVKFDELVLPF